MNERSYPFDRLDNEIEYKFTSVSQERSVNKLVLFTRTNIPEVFNLALCDQFEDGQLSDISESRNGDMRTVLATVMQIVRDFFDLKPEAVVAFKGSDSRRHRLYSIIISRELNELQQYFEIRGYLKNGKVEIFVSNREYEYYLIQKII